MNEKQKVWETPTLTVCEVNEDTEVKTGVNVDGAMTS